MKGETTVIESLNKALKMELTAINQYMVHSHILEDWGLARMAAKWTEEADEEKEHANKLIARIIFLEGKPIVQELNEITIGESLKNILEADLQGELDACAFYKEGRHACQKESDYGSMKIFDTLLMDEEGHVEYLETQLNLLKLVGEKNYAMLQAEAANAEE